MQKDTDWQTLRRCRHKGRVGWLACMRQVWVTLGSYRDVIQFIFNKQAHYQRGPMLFETLSAAAGLWKFVSLKTCCLGGFFICRGRVLVLPGSACWVHRNFPLLPFRKVKGSHSLHGNHNLWALFLWFSLYWYSLSAAGQDLRMSFSASILEELDSQIASELHLGNEFSAKGKNSCLLILLNIDVRMWQVELFLELLGWLWTEASPNSANIFSNIWVRVN